MTGDKYNYDSRVQRYERKNLGNNADKVIKANTNEDIEVFGDAEVAARKAELEGMKGEGLNVIATDRGNHSGISFDFMYGAKEENGHGGLMRYVEAGIFEDYTVEGFTRSDAQNLGNKMNEIEKRNKGKEGFIVKGKTEHFDGRMQLGDGRHYTYDEFLELADAAGYRLKDGVKIEDLAEVVPKDQTVVQENQGEEAVGPKPPVETTDVKKDEGKDYVVEYEATTITQPDGSSATEVTGTVIGPDGKEHKVKYTTDKAADDPAVSALTEGEVVATLEKVTKTDENGNETVSEELVVTVNGEPANKEVTEQVRQAFNKAADETKEAEQKHDELLNGGVADVVEDTADNAIRPSGSQEVKSAEHVVAAETKSEAADDAAVLGVLNAMSNGAAGNDEVSAEEEISDQEWLEGQIAELTDGLDPTSIDAGVKLRNMETDIYHQMYNLKQSAKVEKRTGFLGLGGKRKVDREFTPEEQKKYDELAEQRQLLNTLYTFNQGMSHDYVESDPNNPNKSQQYFRVAVQDNDGNISFMFAPGDTRYEFEKQVSEDRENGTVRNDLKFYGATVVEQNGQYKFVIDKNNVLNADQVAKYARSAAHLKY